MGDSLMNERAVYLNGEYVPESEAKVSVLDRGFRWGDAVYDAVRTFEGRPFKLEEHVDRFYRSLRYARIEPGLSKTEMSAITLEVIKRNEGRRKRVDGDYLVTMQASRGSVGQIYRPVGGRPTVTVYCLPITFDAHAKYYREGAHVIVPSVRRTPPECVSPRAKVSNKMNHFQAELEVKAVDPDAFALMLDMDGNIAESTGSDFLFVSGGVLRIPQRRTHLTGVSLLTAVELAEKMGMKTDEGAFTLFDLYNAEEAMLTASTFCLLPVVRVNGMPIGEGRPGPVVTRLLELWKEFVGFDFVEECFKRTGKGTSGRSVAMAL